MSMLLWQGIPAYCLPREEIPATNKHFMNTTIPKAIQTAIEHHQAGRLPQAEAIYQQVLQVKPDHPDALHLLGVVAHQVGKNEFAVELIIKAIRLKPSEPAYYNNLGMALEAQGKLVEAAEVYRQALLLKPGYAKAHYNLGNTLQTQGKLDAAVASYHNAISCQRDYAEAHNNLGAALQDQGKLDEAVEHCYKALSINPDYPEVFSNLGNALKNQGKLEAAVESFHQALSLKPDYADARTNLLFLYSYHALNDPHEYLSLARNWEQACVPAREWQLARDRIFRRLPLAGRRMRVGYVSGDYRLHPVSYFIEQLFAHHDRARIELFAYSANLIRDAVTERLQALVDH